MKGNKDLGYYKDCFSSLHTMKKAGKHAPHKALLLLSVIDLIERGIITDSHIPLSEELIKQFKLNTKELLGDSILFQPTINYPYYHLHSEPFWRLVSEANCKIEGITNYSLANLRKNIAYAQIDDELFNLLKDQNVRAKLRVVLIATYLNNQPTLADNLSFALLALGYLTSMVA